MDNNYTEKFIRIMNYISETQKKEQAALDASTEEILKKLHINYGSLPQKCQHLLQDLANHQSKFGVQNLDPIAIAHIHSKEVLDSLDDDYELLKLKQKNAELDSRIERNRKEIEFLRAGLDQAKLSLKNQTPNPETIEADIRALKQKVISYEENCERAKMKFTKLNVPDALYPKAMEVLISQLCSLKEQEVKLKEEADDIVFTEQLRGKLKGLRL